MSLLCGGTAFADAISCVGTTTPDGGCGPVDQVFSLNGTPMPVTIDWSNASVVITNTTTTSATVTGTTTGSLTIPFVVTITTVGGTQGVTRSQLGNYNNALNMNIPATRNSGTLMTVNIALTGYSMVAASFSLLDVDTSETGAPFAGWQDRITLLGANAGTTLTPVNTGYATVSGMVTTGVNGNVVNTSNLGNVAVAEAGTLNAIRMTFGPGPSDQFGQNQRFGLTNIAISDVELLTPEPGTNVLLGAGLLLIGAWAHRRRARTRP